MICLTCSGKTFRPAMTQRRMTVGGVLFTGETAGLQCVACGEVTVAAADAQAFNDRVTRELVERGPASGEGLAVLRRAAGLQAQELAKLLDVSPVSVSRWENGKSPIDRATWVIVGALTLEQIEGGTTTRGRLRALAKKRRLRVRVPATIAATPGAATA
jgi:DNA-binding transcriptional regulator YiaG